MHFNVDLTGLVPYNLAQYLFLKKGLSFDLQSDQLSEYDYFVKYILERFPDSLQKKLCFIGKWKF